MIDEAISNNKILTGKYFDDKGQLVNEIINGNGKYTDHYLSGEKRCIAVYQNGVNEGEIKWFYINGNIENYTIIQNGKVIKNENYEDKE